MGSSNTPDELATPAAFLEYPFTPDERLALALFGARVLYPLILGGDFDLEEFHRLMEMLWQRPYRYPLRRVLDGALYRLRVEAGLAEAKRMTAGAAFAPLLAVCCPRMTPIQPYQAVAVFLTLRRGMPIDQVHALALATKGLLSDEATAGLADDWFVVTDTNTKAKLEPQSPKVIPFADGCLVERYDDEIGLHKTKWMVGEPTYRLPRYTRIVLSVPAGVD